MSEAPQGDLIEVAKAEVLALGINEKFVVVTADDATSASEALGKVKLLGKQLETARKAELEPLNEKIRDVNARYTDPRDLLVRAEETIKRALLGFRETETKRLEAQRRIEAEAAAKERARLEEQARKTREKAEAEAAKLSAAGKEERAQAVLQTGESQARAAESVAQLVAAPVQAAAPTKLDGTSVREVWKGKVVDSKAFLPALLASPYDLDEIVSFSASGLNKLASTLKGKMDSTLPGSIAWSEQVVAARAR